MRASLSQVCDDARLIGERVRFRLLPKAPSIRQRLIGGSATVLLLIVALVVGLVAFGTMAVARRN